LFSKTDYKYAKELRVFLEGAMPKGVGVIVVPRYLNGESNGEELIPSMFEVTFTPSGSPHKGLSKEEREAVRKIMFDDDTKESIVNILEPYQWGNPRVCTRNRVTDEELEYIWKIEHRPPEKAKGPPGSVRDFK